MNNMIPKELHLKELNRFHDEIESIENEIENEPNKHKKLELNRKWHRLIKQWNKIDNFIETEVKDFLDSNTNN